MTKTTYLEDNTYLCGSCGAEFAGRDAREIHFDETGHGLRRFAARTPILRSEVEPHELSFLAEHHGETEHVGFVAEPAEREPYVRDPRVDEAIEFAKGYEGDFEFMVSMKAKCSKPVARLTPKMVDGILKCKARAEKDAEHRTAVAAGLAAAPVRPNRYAGTCGNCGNEVAEAAGRIEKVDGRWLVFHLDGTCPAKVETPAAPAAPKTSTPTPDVPAGHYAVETEEGHLAFYRVDRPTEGRWAGRTFVSVQASDDYHPVKGEAGKSILRKIAEAPQEAMLRYGQEIGRCGHCNRTLTDETSRALGIGPVCRANVGF